MAASTIKPPTGFVLDPKPPSGFILDKPEGISPELTGLDLYNKISEVPFSQDFRPYDPSQPPTPGQVESPYGTFIKAYGNMLSGLGIPFERFSKAFVAPIAKLGQAFTPDIKNALDWIIVERQVAANTVGLSKKAKEREMQRLRKIVPYEKPDRTALKQMPITLKNAAKALIPLPGMTKDTESVAQIASKYYEEMTGEKPPFWYGGAMDFATTIIALHGVQKAAKFIAGFAKWAKGKPQAQIRPARAEVDAAAAHYHRTGDRTRWDAVRIKYAGITPEGVARIRARAKPPTVKEFGKYPLARPIKRPPTIGKLAPRKPVAPITPTKGVESPKAPIVKPEMPKGIKKGDTFREASQDWKVIGLGQTTGGDIGILGETERGQRVIFDPEFIRQKLAKPEAVEVIDADQIIKKIDNNTILDEQAISFIRSRLKEASEGRVKGLDIFAVGALETATNLTPLIRKMANAASNQMSRVQAGQELLSPEKLAAVSGIEIESINKFLEAQPVAKPEAVEVAPEVAAKQKYWGRPELKEGYTPKPYLKVKATVAVVNKEGEMVGTKARTFWAYAKEITEGRNVFQEVTKEGTKKEAYTIVDKTEIIETKPALVNKHYGELEVIEAQPVAKAEPTKVEAKKFVREARAEAKITKAEMGIVKLEPGTGVPYWHTAATQSQKDKILNLAKQKAMVSEKGKLKPQFRKIAGIYTGEKYLDRLTKDEADTLISVLLKLPEPKMKAGKLIPPSIPRTTALTPKGFFQRRFKRPTPATLITSNTYYAEKLGVKSLVEPLEKAKMRFDLEHQKASNELDRMGRLIDKIGKTTTRERLAAKKRNIPTRARTEMGNLLDSYEEAPANLSPEKKEIFNWFRNLTKTMLSRQNEAREKLGWPLIKNRKAYMRHIATDVSRDMLAGKYPFPEGIGFWSGLNVGKKVFNPMEFQRRLEDDVHGLFTTDPVYASKAMMHNALKEIHLNQPLKFFNEQLNALGKDLPEYRNLSPRERNDLDRTMVIPADTRRWLIDYVNNVIKGQQTMPDRLVNNIVNESGLKGLLNTALKPYGRVLSQRPITRFFQTAGRMQMAGVIGPRPRLLIRNKFQLTQNLALYGMKANVRAFLPPNKELKELLEKSLFLKSYTGLEELPIDLAKKVEKLWHKAYQWTATSNARQAMEVAYWDIKELIDNPKYKKYGWKPEHLLKEMEFGASATQYQYNAIGMPGIFRHKSLIPATRLTSWWMNYFAKFHREALHRAFTGRPSWSGEKGPTLPWSRRLGWLRYAVLGGLILNTMGYTRSYMFGAAPTGWPPALQAVDGLYKYIIADDDKRRKAAKTKFYNAAKTFIPGYIAYKDFDAVWTGRKDLKSLFFYEKRKKKKE